ncbi:hypothetical protein GR198_05690 [Rhizobium leguminosarum]|uniref:hypothetical protein n=1 Tax=Rhizobium leguminosarum TaxID=384 RepID=UPI0013C28923|nr:hypothetical protein [Rhizobium leguminosarum]NEH55238.1 hypothetical protein [Rhizobium leguminosarum]
MVRSPSPRKKKQAKSARWHGLQDTPATDPISQPSLARHRLLPIVDVGSIKFEHLCQDLLRNAFKEDVRRVALKRRSGFKQFGADIEGFDELQRPVVVVSCKCYRAIDAFEVRLWIEDFRKHLDDHWAKKGVKHFVLAVSVEFNDDDMNGSARALAEELHERGIRFWIWDSVELSEMLRRDPATVEKYFNKYWREAIAGDLPEGAPTQTTSAPFAVQNPVIVGGIFAQIEAQYLPQLNDLAAKTLEHALQELREGRRSAFVQWLADARGNDVVWAGTSNKIRSKALRAAAMVALADGDVKEASALLDQSETLQQLPDRTARAMLLRATEGMAAAVSYLTDPADRKERETLAGFLIESNRPKDALEVLLPMVGDDASSDVMRLRAIAKFLAGGSVGDALSLANSAVAKDPDSPMARMALGQIRLASALVSGLNLQFGSVPNPISRALVRPAREARVELAAAAQEFERVRSNVEGEFRRNVEVWKLAALLLNRETFTEARSFARGLLARDELEPAVVVWCMQYGVPLKKGHIKKQLWDILRNGTGSPGHVAVLALLSAASDRPDKGLAVVERFAPKFPEASLFFDHWRDQFAPVNSEGVSNFAATVRTALQAGDVMPLVDFLYSDGATIENLIAGAEVLARRNAFAELDSLRNRLAATRTDRGVELAATAALNVDDPEGSQRLLDEALAVGMEENPRLHRLRLMTNEALGNHAEVIRELEHRLSKEHDEFLRDKLLNAYLRVGDLDKLKKHAELGIEAGTIAIQNAVKLAWVLRDFAPDTARRALQSVPKEKITDEMAAAIFQVSIKLGLTGLQDEMLQKIFSRGDGTPMFRKFDRVEDAIAMVKQAAADQLQRVEEWLQGRLPAVSAMGGDGKEFAMLLLSPLSARLDGVPYKIPLMLRSGISARDVEPVGAIRRRLRLDLSGLLLSDRLELLEPLESCFDIEVPESLPEALMEAAGAIAEFNQAAALAVRSLTGGDRAVLINDEVVHADEIMVSPKGIIEDHKAAFAHVVDEAFRAGHLTRTRAETIFEEFKIEKTDTRRRVDKILLSGNVVAILARIGVLDDIVRGFPVEMRMSELKLLVTTIDRLEEEARVKGRLVALRKIVADRLSSSKWKSITPNRDLDDAAGLSAHMRCLLETLPKEEGPEGGLFWIEDRAISKQKLRGGLDLPGVIAYLADAGAIEPRRRDELSLELRRIGYLFVPMDAKEVVATIERAAVDRSSLVENVELADLRRWFARDVLHLRYLDQTPVVDEEGRFVGEGRRTIDLSHFAADLIELVWKSEQASTEEKTARSNWIWTALRLDFVPSPPFAGTDTARRQMASLSAMQVLTIPLQADLRNDRLPKNAQQPFVDWAMGKIVRPLNLADEEAGDEVVRMAASTIASLFKFAGEEDPAFENDLRHHLSRMVGSFLDLLPHEWDTRITSLMGLRGILGRETMLLVDLDTRHQVVVRDISYAIAESRRKGEQTPIELYPRGLQAMLTATGSSEGSPVIVIASSEGTWRLHESTVALLSPDEEERESLLLALTAGTNVGNPMTREFLTEVAREQDVDRRVDIFHKRIKADYARTRETLWEKVSTGGAIHITDLAVPPPEDILNFLGLPGDFRGDGSELLSAALPILKDALGIDEAVSRLSGLPLRLPDDLLRELGEQIEAEDEMETDFLSPMMSLSLMAGIVLSGKQIPNGAEALFSQERTWLFLTILRHVARQTFQNVQWSALPDEMMLCLVWVHANEMAKNLSVDGLDAVEVAKWIAERTPTPVLDREKEVRRSDWIVQCATRMSAPTFIAAALCELMRRGATLPDEFKHLIGQDGPAEFIIHTDVLVPRRPASSNYWVAQDNVPELVACGWLSTDHPFVERDPTALLLQALSQGKELEWSVLVSMIEMFVDLERVDAEALSALEKLLDFIANTDGIKSSDPRYDAFAIVRAKVCRLRDDSAGFSAWIGKSASGLDERWPGRTVRLSTQSEAGVALAALVNACYVFAWTGGESVRERVGTLCELLVVIANAWPGTTGVMISCLDILSQQATVEVASESLLPTLLELRSR